MSKIKNSKLKDLEIEKKPKYGQRKYRKKLVSAILGSVLVFSMVTSSIATKYGTNSVYAENGVCPNPYTVESTPSVPNLYKGGNVFARNEAAYNAAETCVVDMKDLGEGKKHVTVTFTGKPSTSDPHFALLMSGYKVVSDNFHFTVTPSTERTDGSVDPDVVFDWPKNSPNMANDTSYGLHDDGVMKVITPNPLYPMVSNEPNIQALQGWHAEENNAGAISFMENRDRLDWNAFPVGDKRGADFNGTIEALYYFRSENARAPIGSEAGNTRKPIKVEFDVLQTAKEDAYIGGFYKSYDYAQQWMRITTLGQVPGETLTKEDAKNVANGYIDDLTNLSAAQKQALKDEVAQKDKVLEKGDTDIANYSAKDTIRNVLYRAEQMDKDMKTLREEYNKSCPVKDSDNYTKATPESKQAYDDALQNAKDIIDGNKIPVAGDENTDGSIANAIKKIKDAEKALTPAQPDNEKYEPNKPAEKVKVADPAALTDDEKAAVKKAVEDANKDNFPAGTEVTVADNGDVTVTYPDKTTDTIPGTEVVEKAKDADVNEPKKPAEKVEVKDPSNLTDEEKDKVKKAVEDANGGVIPGNGVVTVGQDGTVTVTYPDGSKDTIPGTDVVKPAPGTGTTDADKNEPKKPAEKVEVKDPSNLTDEEKDKVKKAVEDANGGVIPGNGVVTVGQDGTVTVTYPDGSKDTIPGTDVVKPAPGTGTTDADKNEPKKPAEKVEVKDPSNLTDEEKDKVKKAVEDANGGVIPGNGVVTVGQDGTVTVTYPDGSKDTIPGTDVVKPAPGTGTDADKNEPKKPAEKVEVKDPSNLTDEEKDKVKKAVEDANGGVIPGNGVVTVGQDGTVTVTYPDGSTDTIPGTDVVKPAPGTGTTDADKNEPKKPAEKVEVKDPSNLTDEEKDKVKKAVEDANGGVIPGNGVVTVGQDGTVTITYPDGSTDTIPGKDLVTPAPGTGTPTPGTGIPTDAETNEPKKPAEKVEVKDPSNLTDEEKNKVIEEVKKANDGVIPGNGIITVGKDGTVTIVYPDGSTDVISGKDLVAKKLITVKPENVNSNIPKTNVGGEGLFALGSLISGVLASVANRFRKKD